jgi:hypothetical protein
MSQKISMSHNNKKDTKNLIIACGVLFGVFALTIVLGIFFQDRGIDANYLLVPLMIAVIPGFLFVFAYFAIKKKYKFPSQYIKLGLLVLVVVGNVVGGYQSLFVTLPLVGIFFTVQYLVKAPKSVKHEDRESYKLGYTFIALGIVLGLIFIGAFVWGSIRNAPREFVSNEGKFSITFTGDPKYEPLILDSEIGKLVLHKYILDKGTVSFFASYIDYPKEQVNFEDTEAALDYARDGSLANSKGILVSEEKITLQGYPGRRLTVKVGETGKINSLLLLVDYRLYQIIVTYSSKIFETESEEFLNSFKLLK